MAKHARLAGMLYLSDQDGEEHLKLAWQAFAQDDIDQDVFNTYDLVEALVFANQASNIVELLDRYEPIDVLDVYGVAAQLFVALNDSIDPTLQQGYQQKLQQAEKLLAKNAPTLPGSMKMAVNIPKKVYPSKPLTAQAVFSWHTALAMQSDPTTFKQSYGEVAPFLEDITKTSMLGEAACYRLWRDASDPLGKQWLDQAHQLVNLAELEPATYASEVSSYAAAAAYAGQDDITAQGQAYCLAAPEDKALPVGYWLIAAGLPVGQATKSLHAFFNQAIASIQVELVQYSRSSTLVGMGRCRAFPLTPRFTSTSPYL